jgi:hypothetical protein
MDVGIGGDKPMHGCFPLINYSLFYMTSSGIKNVNEHVIQKSDDVIHRVIVHAMKFGYR